MRLLFRLLAAGTMLVACFGPLPGEAQPYPSRPIRIIAPFPAGGLVDVLARAVGEELAKTLGQPVIVENKPGAGGNIGADVVAKAEPDGYTLLMTSPGIQSINQFLYAKMPFDPDTAFVPISIVADMPMLVVVHPKVGAKTLQELIGIARAKPGQAQLRLGRRRHDRPSRPGDAHACGQASRSPMCRIAARRRRSPT